MTICDRTGLTKPECHCAACTAAMIATHAPAIAAAMAPPAGARSAGSYQPLAVEGRI
jgi:hypothetical protein